jgi:hypothetical protein
MTYPLANYLSRYGLAPTDEQRARRAEYRALKAAAVSGYGYDDDDDYGYGAVPGLPMPNPERRRARCEAFLARNPATVTNPEAVEGDFYGADAWDGTDQIDMDELGEDDAELDALGEDDEDAYGADEDEALGATIAQVEKKIDKLDAKIAELQAKYNSTPPNKRKKRKALLKRIARAKSLKTKKEAKKEKKIGIIAAKLGLPASALAAGGLAAGGAAAAIGVSKGRVARMEQQIERRRAYNLINGPEGAGSTSAGREVRIPFVDALGSPVQRITIAPGAGLRTAAIDMFTQIIPYADFEVVSLDAQFSAVGTAAEMLLNVLVQTLIVNGGINLLYQTENLNFGAQTVNGQLTVARTIPGLRANPGLQANNTAQLSALVRQEITTAQTIEIAFQAALVVNVTRDPQAARTM